ncbi:glycosyltransferase [Vibrio cholerae]|uniref:glycosyltransferase n=1 Tax=Vibrio cholerae TaxID=666 RepID=UPI000F3DEA91|nr:glycosyltransferase [Vibrio cholerae]MCQ0983651.1 glycosyltransferase [Vibrio cholerae]RNE65801.1 glycosyltransferase [Vibrio cholerae]
MRNINKITIITLTYKNWHLLDKAITSVASQITNENFEMEYLIVDDGTKDFDIEYVVNILSGTHLNYRIIVNPENIGTVASFNNAIRQSTGDIILPLSADDEFYDSNVVNDIVAEFVSTGSYIVTGLRVPILNAKECDPIPSKKQYEIFKDRRLLLKKIIKENVVSGASTYYRREVFDIVGYFDVAYKLLEDYPFYIDVLSSGIDIHLFKRNVIKYGMSGVSSASSRNPILQNDYLTLHNKILTRSDLSNFERREILYFKIFNKREKLKNAWRHPDLFVRMVCKKVLIVLTDKLFKN